MKNASTPVASLSTLRTWTSLICARGIVRSGETRLSPRTTACRNMRSVPPSSVTRIRSVVGRTPDWTGTLFQRMQPWSSVAINTAAIGRTRLACVLGRRMTGHWGRVLPLENELTPRR